MEIFADPKSVNCRKVLAGLKLMDVGYTLAPVDFLQGEHKQEPYTALNPNGSLPALRDGALTLWESNAILQYAAEQHGKAAFYPAEPGPRADVNRWLFWEAASWFPSCYVYLAENCVKPLMGGSPDTQVIEQESERFALLASILDERLAQSAWLCGDRPTIADIAVAAPMHLHRWAQLPLGPHGNLTRWMTEQIEQLPAWKETHVEDGFGLL